MVTFRRLGWILDRIPYFHAPLLEAALGKRRLVLDLGGGTGRVARRLIYERVVVCDPDPALLARARRKSLAAVRCDARHLPVRAGAADGAIAVDALHHMPDQERVLQEAFRALAPGGRLVVEEFDPASFGGRLVERGEDWLHFGSTFRKPADLRAMAGEAGFEARIERWSRRDYALVADKRPISES